MTDTERIAFLERTESSVTALREDDGRLCGWLAHCPPRLVGECGKTWRDAVDALRKEMEK